MRREAKEAHDKCDAAKRERVGIENNRAALEKKLQFWHSRLDRIRTFVSGLSPPDFPSNSSIFGLPEN